MGGTYMTDPEILDRDAVVVRQTACKAHCTVDRLVRRGILVMVLRRQIDARTGKHHIDQVTV